MFSSEFHNEGMKVFVEKFVWKIISLILIITLVVFGCFVLINYYFQNNLFVITLSFVSLNFLSMFTIYLFFEKWYITPLDKLYDVLDSSIRGVLGNNLKIETDSRELQPLVNRIVTLCSNVHREIEELKQKNYQINKHRWKLSDVLRDRTNKLKDIRSKFEDITMSSGDWIWEVNNEGIYEFASSRVADILGYTPEEMVGKSVFDLMDENEAEKIKKEFQKIVEKKVVIMDLENWMISKSGEKKCFSTRGVPIFNRDGEIKGYRGVDKDITESKKAAERFMNVQISERSATEANKAKTEFLANISHELRTPMHGILSFAKYGIDDLKDGTVSKEEILQDFVEIYDSSNRLLHLLNDLLDLAKMESGKVEYMMVKDDVMILFDDIISEFSKLASDKGIKFNVNCCDDATAFFDPTRLIQVIRNIISNAIKFATENSVIEIIIENQLIDGVEWIISTVKNVGEEIPESDLDLIFDKFAQSSRTAKRSDGTGLGLSISRQIINDHHGRIWAESGGGKTSFFFTIPKKAME